ncbi:MAG: hypothetical protein J5736_03215, partial [Bacilli bacterium]|nr:hypothetical protein [Bacilli bacterium]
MDENPVLEPLKEFPSLYEKVGQKAAELFEQYADKAAIDRPKNKETVDQYKKACNELDNQKQFAAKLSAKKGGFIFLIIISFIL